MRSIRRSAITLLVITSLSACGGGGSSGDTSNPPPPPPPPPQTNQSPGGIWTVQYQEASGPNTGDTIQGRALVTEAGDLFFAGLNTANGCAVVGFGQVTVTGSAVSGSTQDAIVPFTAAATTCSYPDGSTSGTSTLSGTVSQRSSLSLTDTSTTSLGMALGSETHTWAYSSLYSEIPSLTNIAGNYADGADTLTISANGTIFEQDPTTGCVINGTASIVDPSYNAYALSVTWSSCTGTSAALNGQTATGLGYLDDSVTPNQVVFGVRLTVGGQTYVLAGALNKM
jgi:hypothetical protein